MSKKQPKFKKGQPPPIDKLLKPAIGIALAIIAYQFIKGLGGAIKRVNLANESDLREIFFGEGNTGKSYAVLCHGEDSTIPLSSVFQEAYNERGNIPNAEFRLLDCNYILPSSEKSVAERFKLDLNKRPTIFLSGAVGAPHQIQEKYLKTGAMLVQYLKGKLETRAGKIETTGDLKSKCLDKDYCGLLLKGGKKPPSQIKDAMHKLLKDFPDIAFCSIDSSVLYLLNLEDLLPEMETGQARFVVFKKLGGSLAPGGSRLITSYASIHDSSSVTYAYMNHLVSSVVSGSQPTTKLPSLPVVKTRSKKLEEAEKAKRERKIEQQKRAQEKAQSKDSSSSSGGDAEENNDDGSREGRRAERERRRQEHYEKHNVKPKTPEEIAEIERRRRARMEEEAAKWNVAPEDAFEGEQGGDFVSRSSGDDNSDSEIYQEEMEEEQENNRRRRMMMMEEDPSLDASSSRDEDEDDEDIIDLD